MTFSKRELILGSVTFFVVLFGATYWLGEPKMREWQEAKTLRAKYANEKFESEQMIQRKDEWQKELNEMRSTLPKYGADQPVSTELLQMISKSAESQRITLGTQTLDKEKNAGDVSELAINCSWDGDLDALVHFLYDVQVQGAVLDVREINMTPANNAANRLKGSFTVFCAFTRERVPGAPEQKKVQVKKANES